MFMGEISKAGEWGFSLSILSDYLLDGVSQSNSEPALQAQGIYEFDSGIFAGLWASSIDLGPEIPADIELSYMAGYSKALTQSIQLELGLSRTQYIKNSLYDLVFLEAYATAQIAENFSVSYAFSEGSALFAQSRRVRLSYERSLSSSSFLNLGATYVNDQEYIGQRQHYKIGYSKEFGNSMLELNYQTTDIESEFDFQDRASGRFAIVLTLTK